MWLIYSQWLPVVRENRTTQKGSLRWLVAQWKASSDWMVLKASTRRQRENILLNVLDKNGNLPFAQVDEMAIVEGRERRAATPSAANNYLKVMRALFSWAKEMRFMAENPAASVKFIPNQTNGHEPWNAGDVEAYRARWAIGTRQRLAFEIYYWTGLRRGDACVFGRQHIGRDGKVRLRMEKTGDLIEFDMPQQLAEIIAQSPCGDLTYISTSHGKPYVKESLGNEFRAWFTTELIDHRPYHVFWHQQACCECVGFFFHDGFGAWYRWMGR